MFFGHCTQFLILCVCVCLSGTAHRKQREEGHCSQKSNNFVVLIMHCTQKAINRRRVFRHCTRFFFFFLRVRQALHRESNEMKVFVRHVYRQKYGELLVCLSSTTHRKQRGECEFVRHIYRQKYGELLVCLSSATHRNVTSR